MSERTESNIFISGEEVYRSVKKQVSIKTPRASVVDDADEFKERAGSLWVDSNNIKECQKCGTKFTMTNRKHHCRDCGKVFCGKCSNYKLVIHGTLKRACTDCYRKVLGSHSQTQGIHSVKNDRLASVDPAIQNIVTVRKSSNEPGGVDDLTPWAAGLFLVSSEGKAKPSIISQYPTDHKIPKECVNDILALAIPRFSQTFKDNEAFTCNFAFKIRPGAVSSEFEDKILNCFVLYQRTHEINGALKQQSLVIVSKYPFATLFYRFLEKLDEAIEHEFNTQAEQPRDSFNEKSNSNSALYVGYQQLESWPTPIPNVANCLATFGDILQFMINLPHNAPNDVKADLSLLHMGSAALYANSINLISVFGPHGMISHLWAIWELIVVGKDVVVIADDPTQASNAVIALAAMIGNVLVRHDADPLGNCGPCDIRPYITKSDSDYKAILENCKLKGEHSRCSMLMGITEESILDDLKGFAVVIMLATPTTRAAPFLGNQDDFESNATHRESITGRFVGGKGTKSPAEEVLQRYSGRFVAPTQKLTPEATYRKLYSNWRTVEAKGAQVPTLLVFQTEPTPSPYADNVIKRLRKLSKRDYLILGNKILLDHFNELSSVILTPVVQSIAQQSVPMKKPVVKVKKVKIDSKKYIRRREFLDTVLQTLFTFMVEYPTFFAFLLLTPGLIVYILYGLPPIFLISAVLFLNVPDYIRAFTLELLSLSELEKKKVRSGLLTNKPVRINSSDSHAAENREERSNSRESAEDGDTEEVSSSTPERVDFSGVWKRVKEQNFEGFLECQGIGYVQRKVAMSVEVQHIITMDPPYLTAFRLQENAGPIKTDVTTHTGGPPVECIMGKKTYMDEAFWHAPGVLALKKIIQPDKEFEIFVYRYLEDEGQSIRMVCVCNNVKTKKSAEATTWFTRIGNSPNPPPATAFEYVSKTHQEGSSNQTQDGAVTAASQGSNEAGAGQPSAKSDGLLKVDMSGVWTRVRVHNVEAYIGAQGAGFLQRKLAASMALTHTITMNAPDLNAFRLQEVGGPLNTDDIYTVGAPPEKRKLLARTFIDTVNWQPGTPATLTLTRTHEANDFALILSRSFEESDVGETQLVLTATHRDLVSGKETIGTSWFKKIKDSPNPPPVPDLSLISNKNKSEGSELSSAVPPTTSSPEKTPRDKNAEADIINKPSPASRSESLGMEWENDSGSEDNDQRVKHGPLSSVLKVDMSGVWKRVNATGESGAKIKSVVAVTHTITMDPPFYTQVRIEETGGAVSTDVTYLIGAEAVPVKVLKKTFLDKVYWEGEALVHERLHDLRDFVVYLRRYLETDENDERQLRLVSLHRNLRTGEETESVSLFKLVPPGENSRHSSRLIMSPFRVTSPTTSRQKAVSFGNAEVIPPEVTGGEGEGHFDEEGK